MPKERPAATGRERGSATGAATGERMVAAASFRNRDASGGYGSDAAIPAEWPERAKKAWEFYLEEPLVKNCINSWRAFGLGDEIRVTADEEGIQEQAQEAAEALNLSRFVKDMVLQLLVKGDAIGFRQEDGKRLTELVCVNPTSCDVEYEDGKIKSVKQYKMKNGVRSDPKPLDVDSLLHLRWDAPPFEPRGNSMVLPAFESVALLREYRKAEKSIARRWSCPLRFIKVGGHYGNRLIDPTQKDLENIRNLVNKMDGKSGLVVPFYVSVETYGAEGHVLETEKKIGDVKEDIMVAMGLSRALVTGDGPNFSTAMVSLKKMGVMIAEIKQVALELCRFAMYRWCEIAGIDPVLKFEINDLDPTDEIDYKRMLLDLYDRGLISRKTLQSKMELDSAIEQQNSESDGVNLRNERQVRPIIDLAASGIVTPEEARGLLGLAKEKPKDSPESLASLGGSDVCGQICDTCQHHTSDHCGLHDIARPFSASACRFFVEKS